jgi:hypothetical protein
LCAALSLASTGAWFETQPNVTISSASAIQLTATLSNNTGGPIDFDPVDVNTFQLWTVPSVNSPPITILASPAGANRACGGDLYL